MARALAPARGLLIGGTLLVAAAVVVPVLAVEISPSPSPSAGASASASPDAASPSATSPDPSPSPSAAPSLSPAVDPSPSPAASPSTASPRPADAESPEEERSGPGADVTRTGVVGTTTDDQGRTRYSLVVGSTTYILAAGPPWFTGDASPLEAQVGDTVTIGGWLPNGTLTLRVETIDGAAWRAPGKPPWAGGWKTVGESHPGWSQEKSDRWQAKVQDKLETKGVDCWPPGHCKAPDSGD